MNNSNWWLICLMTRAYSTMGITVLCHRWSYDGSRGGEWISKRLEIKCHFRSRWINRERVLEIASGEQWLVSGWSRSLLVHMIDAISDYHVRGLYWLLLLQNSILLQLTETGDTLNSKRRKYFFRIILRHFSAKAGVLLITYQCQTQWN